MSDYISALKSFMKEKELQDLSSFGWARMRQAKRDLEAEKIAKEEFIEKFLEERDFAKTIGRDRHLLEELRKIFK